MSGQWLHKGGLLLGCLCVAMGSASAQALQTLQVTRVAVQARAEVPELSCAAPLPARKAPAQPEQESPVPPDAQEVQAQVMQEGTMALPLAVEPPGGRWLSPRAGLPLRVALWGDSHLAAGFFSAELGRQLQLEAEQVQPRWLPATMGRAGVRLPLRKSCVTGGWRYEPAHADPRWAASAGPAMVSMSAATPGASLAWDLRLGDGRAERQQVRLLYQQTEAPVQLALRVDEGEPQILNLQGPAGPAVLELQGDAPLSTVRLELLQGRWRWHALELPMLPTTRLQLDVFGYPGATVAGWKYADSDEQQVWWRGDDYDLVALAFGTNEGNVQPFDAAAYASTLRAAVRVWRARFAASACVLIGPGDRGVLVTRSSKKSRKGSKSAAKPFRVDLLRFTRVHAEINRLQQQVAQEQGCRFWSAFQAMGGAGGAYRWQARQPALMARDLIHFTVPGYQQLARQFAGDMGWQPTLLETPAPAARP